jgi:hypothetical protein
MTINLSISDSASLSSVMICCIAVETFNVSLLVELEAYTDRLFSEFPVVAAVAAWGPTSFSHMSAVPVVAGVACLYTVQHRTAPVR